MRTSILYCLLFVSDFSTFAQEGVIDRISRAFKESHASHPIMRPLIFFSQDKYAPGDTAFFRLFMLAENEKDLPLRTLLSLELIDKEGAVITRQFVPCEKAGVANQIILPEKMSSGMYQLNIFGERSSKNFSFTCDFVVAGERILEKVTPKEPTVDFFPEGGNLVTGSVNKMILRSNNAFGGDGELHSQEGKIARFEFDENGFGSVQFVPTEGSSYWIEVPFGNRKKSISVPKFKNDKLTLRLYPGPGKTNIINIIGAPAYRSKTVFLLLLSQREVMYGQKITLDAEGKKQILGAPDFLPDGYSQLVVVDSSEIILASRPVYRSPKSTLTLNMGAMPAHASQRQIIKVSLSMSDEKGNPLGGAFALTAFANSSPAKLVATPDPSLILNPDPIDPDLSGTEESINMQLIAIATNIQQLVPVFSDLPLHPNLTLAGRAYYKDPTLTLPDSSRIIIYLHKDLIHYEAIIDKSGHFYFPKIYDFFGNDRIFHNVTHKNKDLPRVLVEWETDQGKQSKSYNRKNYAEGILPDEYETLRKKKKEIDRSYSFFLTPQPDHELIINSNEPLEDEFQEADIVINPKEYLPFETMEELILEVIPSLEFRKRQPDSVVRAFLTTKSPFVAKRYSDGNPLFVIDGLMSTETGFLMKVKPKDVVSFKIINDIGKLDRLGNLARNGIVFVQTLSPEKTQPHLAKNLYQINGLSPTLIFSNRYPLANRVPDLRTNLYWNPLLKTDSTGVASFEFRTSDVPGSYTLRVMGVTEDGRMVASESSFSVAFKK